MPSYKWQGKSFVCSCGSTIYDPVGTQGYIWRCNSCNAAWEYWSTKFNDTKLRAIAYSIHNQLDSPSWVCHRCADFVPVNELCPKCGANQTIILAASEAKYLLSVLEK